MQQSIARKKLDVSAYDLVPWGKRGGNNGIGKTD